MSIEKIKLDDSKELEIRSKEDWFSDRFRSKLYRESIKEIVINTGEQRLCIGLCVSNSYTGEDEFIQYSNQCVIFFKGNCITKKYRVERVFDVATMHSSIMNKEEIKEKYDIDLPEEVGDPVVKRKYSRNKGLSKNPFIRRAIAN
ncbi:MAG: hypothetical protein K2G03_05515 [Bacilli bacterium]|nr:hypothetical protein [Bacilli bacterium]